MKISIIGIDCATLAKNIGLAWGCFNNGKATVKEMTIGSKCNSIAVTITDWIAGAPSALIAMDAPLGWPTILGRALSDHVAGDLVRGEPNELFRRTTDRFIKDKIGKQPLDVGADRIARTAHAALTLLDEIREKTGNPIPLAWIPGYSSGFSAIEVYPAATLIVHNIHVPGYKHQDGREARLKLVGDLQRVIDLPTDTTLLENNDDVLDAVVCVLAGADFLRGDVYEPADSSIARKEGWIWVRKKSEIFG